MIGFRSYMYNPDLPEEFSSCEEDLVSEYGQKYYCPKYSFYNTVSPFVEYDNTPELYDNVIIGDYVKECGMLFANCVNFNKPVIFNNLFDCEGMFYQCYSFNQPMTFEHFPQDCSRMFYYCRSLNSPIVFKNEYSDFYLDGKFNGTFYACFNFNQPVIIPYLTYYVNEMFAFCNKFNQNIVIPQTVSNCSYMLTSCKNYGSNIYFKGNSNRTLDCIGMLNSRNYITSVYNEETHSYESVNVPAPAAYVHVHPDLANTVKNNIIWGITWTELPDGNGWYNDSPNYNVYIYNNYSG